jgi:Flp pilus assembly protein CpaB
MIRIIVITIVLALFVSTVSAQQPAPAPAKPVTYALSPDQAATLKRALALADFWLQVRVAAAGNTADGHGYELERAELQQLAQVLQQQEQAAAAPPAKPAEPASKESPAVADPPTPAPH